MLPHLHSPAVNFAVPFVPFQGSPAPFKPSRPLRGLGPLCRSYIFPFPYDRLLFVHVGASQCFVFVVGLKMQWYYVGRCLVSMALLAICKDYDLVCIEVHTVMSLLLLVSLLVTSTAPPLMFHQKQLLRAQPAIKVHKLADTAGETNLVGPDKR